MKEQIKSKFIEYQTEMLQTLADLITIPSVRGETTPEFPYGEEPARALAQALTIAEKLGFQTDNVDNHACAIEYGDGAEAIGVLAHLDVVPAGNGWDTDPFKLVIQDGKMYGRGVVDDKGPAVAALYGMCVLRDLGLPLKRKIRLILGTNEEQGSSCMKYYVEHRPIPLMGFTPDASYPLIHGEKGSFHAKLYFPAEVTPVLALKGGVAFNAVCSECITKLDGRQVDAKALRSSIQLEDSLGYGAEVTEDEAGNVILTVKGLAAHGSTPEIGVNAIVSTANILCRFLGEKAGKQLFFLKDRIGREPDGKTLGLKYVDEISGSLSLNLGMAEMTSQGGWLGIDIRYPVTSNLAEMVDRFQKMADRFELTFEEHACSEPHYVPKDSEVVSKLLKVYRDATGKQDAEAFTIGGGTYAKAMGSNFVAFGPEFPDGEPTNIHNVGEQISLDTFLEHCVICTLAMYELAR